MCVEQFVFRLTQSCFFFFCLGVLLNMQFRAFLHKNSTYTTCIYMQKDYCSTHSVKGTWGMVNVQMNTAKDEQNLFCLQTCKLRQETNTHGVPNLVVLMLPLLIIAGEVWVSLGLSGCLFSTESIFNLRSQKQSPDSLLFYLFKWISKTDNLIL